MIVTLIATLAAGCFAFGAFYYCFRQGEFDECEEIKYQLFREDED